jgi:phenylacetate-coenzyme A ligase PaaK-like adenylate-forming protein
VVYAYPTPLALFCEYLRDCGRPHHHPVTVICTAEPLLVDQRQVIEQALGCPVFEHYGTRDFGMVGAECELHQGMHWNPAAVFVEFIPLQGAEEEGLHEMLVTDLLNFGMPMIRYRINDCAVRGAAQCGCGRGYPLVGRIMGRTADVFQLPNGNSVPGISLHRVVTELCPGLKKIQIVQDTLTNFRVRFVPGESFRPADFQFLVERLDERFGDSIHWEFERVAEIERERSGKTRFCISHVKSVGAGLGLITMQDVK